jgi:NhaP-type Na+/H+ or K+/H+ antiporter
MNISLLMILLAILIFNAGLRLKISHLKNIWLAGWLGWLRS